MLSTVTWLIKENIKPSQAHLYALVGKNEDFLTHNSDPHSLPYKYSF